MPANSPVLLLPPPTMYQVLPTRTPVCPARGVILGPATLGWLHCMGTACVSSTCRSAWQVAMEPPAAVSAAAHSENTQHKRPTGDNIASCE